MRRFVSMLRLSWSYLKMTVVCVWAMSGSPPLLIGRSSPWQLPCDAECLVTIRSNLSAITEAVTSRS